MAMILLGVVSGFGVIHGRKLQSASCDDYTGSSNAGICGSANWNCGSPSAPGDLSERWTS